jgi:hypothetical protein
MASGITNYQVPQAYQPAYNRQMFVASSSNYTQPNFSYTVICTDIITGLYQTWQVPFKPDFSMEFNAGTFVKDYVKNYIPINTYGWQLCTNAIRRIKVNIGETYDIAGVSTYTAGTDKFYYVWNGVVDFLDFTSYSYNTYVYNSETVNIKYLTDSLNEKVYSDRSNMFYALTSKANDIGTLKIETYNEAGTLLGTSYIANPYVASVTYTDKYLCIDLGLKGLTNISGGLVTGTFPIITSSVAYYTVKDVSTVDIGFPYTLETLIKTYTVGCSPRYDIITLHALFKTGHYRTIHCPLVSVRKSTISKGTFKKLPYYQPSPLANIINDYNAAVEQVLNVTVQSNLTVNTDWLTEQEVALYEQAIASPSILMDLGSGLGYASVKSLDTSYESKKFYNEKLTQLTINLAYTHDNHRQQS